MKAILKQAARRLGGHVFSDASLPTGVDWLHDIRRSGVLGDAPLCFDVGANTGQTVARLLAIWPRARIHAFEPFATTHKALVAATRGLPGVRAVPLALGAMPGRVQATASLDPLLSSLAFDPPPGMAGPAETVQVETVDTYCAQHQLQEIDVLKTDTEGWDLEVLCGAAGMLAQQRVHYVQSEVSFEPRNRRNTPFRPLFDLLEANDYCFLGLYETWPLHHFAAPNLFCNALFVSRPARERGRLRRVAG